VRVGTMVDSRLDRSRVLVAYRPTTKRGKQRAGKKTKQRENFVRLNLRHRKWRAKKKPGQVAARKQWRRREWISRQDWKKRKPKIIGDTTQMRKDVIDAFVEEEERQRKAKDSSVLPGTGSDFGKAIPRRSVPLCDGHQMPCVQRTVRKNSVRNSHLVNHFCTASEGVPSATSPSPPQFSHVWVGFLH